MDVKKLTLLPESDPFALRSLRNCAELMRYAHAGHKIGSEYPTPSRKEVLHHPDDLVKIEFFQERCSTWLSLIDVDQYYELNHTQPRWRSQHCELAYISRWISLQHPMPRPASALP